MRVRSVNYWMNQISAEKENPSKAKKFNNFSGKYKSISILLIGTPIKAGFLKIDFIEMGNFEFGELENMTVE